MTGSEPGIKIFISYRRAGELGFVRSLTESLSSVYGKENVFRDVSGLRSGDEFERRIFSELSEATVVIAVIGIDWVGRRRFGKPRICSDNDWVRREIEHALASDTPVIPVLVGGAELPASKQLPAALRGLLSVHARRIRDDSWENDCEELTADIEAVARGRHGEGDGEPFVWRRIEEGQRHRPGYVIPSIVIAAALLATFGLWFYLSPPQVTTPGGSSVKLDDPSTWTAPRLAEARSPASHLALQLALLEMQESTKEAGDESAGFNVSKFTERFRLQMPNAPWSAAFVTWCYLEAHKRKKNEADAKLPFADSPSTAVVADSLRQHGWLVEPFNVAAARPGDIIFFRRGALVGHMEIIYAVTNDSICSVGGNVNNQVTDRCTPAGSGSIHALGSIPPEAFQ
jgi:hypothetical protein